jgi:hypothetical protein
MIKYQTKKENVMSESQPFAEAPRSGSEGESFAEAPEPGFEGEPFAEAPQSESESFAEALEPGSEGEPFAEAPESEREPFAEAPKSESEFFAEAPEPGFEGEPFAEAPESAPENEPDANARKSVLELEYAGLYAVAGITDALAEALKGALAETQQRASKRINELQGRRPELSRQAKSGAEDLRAFVITLPEQFRNLPDTTKARIAELQRQANELLAQATATYGDFAWRGKQAVDDVRRSARDRSAKSTKPVTPRGPDTSADSGTDAS